MKSKDKYLYFGKVPRLIFTACFILMPIPVLLYFFHIAKTTHTLPQLASHFTSETQGFIRELTDGSVRRRTVQSEKKLGWKGPLEVPSPIPRSEQG